MARLPIEDWIIAGVVIVGSALVIAFYFRGYRLLKPTTIPIMYITHILGAFIPSMIHLFDPSRPYAADFFWGTVVAAGLIPVGAMIGDLVWPRAADAPQSLYGAPVDTSPEVQRATRRFILCLAIYSTIIFLLYCRGLMSLGGFPIMALFQGVDNEIIKENRFTFSTKNIEGGYIIAVSRRFFMPLLFVCIIASWSFLRSRTYQLLAALAAIMVLVTNAVSAQKTYVATCFMLAVFVIMLRHNAPDNMAAQELRRSKRTTKKAKWKLYAAIGLCLGLVLGYPTFIFLYKPFGELGLATVIFEGVLGRVFWRPALNSYYAFELFPRVLEFTYFMDINKLALVLGYEPINLSVIIALYKSGEFYNAPPPSIGAFYAEYGYTGIVFGVLLASMIFRIYENVIQSMRVHTTISVALYGFILFGAFRFTWGYFHGIFLSEVLVPTALMLLLRNYFLRTTIGEAGSRVSRRSPNLQEQNPP